MTLNIKGSETKTFEPFGSCIYCGAMSDLTREHVIPLGIGGTWILPASSCRDCAQITGRFEQRVLRGPMWPIRSYLELKSRRPEEAPQTIPIDIVRGGVCSTLNLPLDEHPLVLAMPHFDPPRIVSGERAKGISVKGLNHYNFGMPLLETLEALGADDIRLSQSHDYVSFARMIAKIGWSMAATKRIIDRIDKSHCVLNAIIREPDEIGHWVGTFQDPVKSHKKELHRVYISEFTDRNLLVAEVQLFATSKTPTYGVVLGRMDGSPNQAMETDA